MAHSMKSKKIINTIRRLAFAEWGGTETVVWQSVQALSTMGIPTSILATSALAASGDEVRDGCLIQRFDYSYARHGLTRSQRCRLDKKGGDPYSWGLFYNLLKSDCRLLHAHSMQRMAAMTRVAALRKNIPYVVSLHGGQFEVPESEIQDMNASSQNSVNYGRALDLFSKPNRVLADASGIICVGQSEYELVKARFPNKPTVYLPNGVDAHAFQLGDGGQFRKTYGIDAEKKIVLCVGRIDPQKNQLVLVDVLKRMNCNNAGAQYHLVLVGPVTNELYAQNITRAVAVSGQEKNFSLIRGLLPESQDLCNAYQAGDIFVLPSVHEPFGIVVLEAWAAGLPVVAAEVGGLARLVTHNETGLLVDATDSAALAEALLRVFNRPALVRRLVERGYSEATTKYSWEQFAKRLLRFYDDAEHWCYQEHVLSECNDG